MDDETVLPNEKAKRHILKVAMDLNAAEVVNREHIKMKSEQINLLRQASIWSHEIQKKKLRTVHKKSRKLQQCSLQQSTQNMQM